MSEAKHAVLAPSSANRWGVCTGSVALAASLPDLPEDRTAADEGHAAHWVAEQYLAGKQAQVKATGSYEGVAITDDMHLGAQIYFDAISNTVPVDQVIKEVPVKSSFNEAVWGRPDAFYFDKEKLTLHVWDYKFGFGAVDLWNNKQLLCYASGAMAHYADEIADPEQLSFLLTVVAPRQYRLPDPVQTQRISYADIKVQWDLLAQAAEAALGAGAVLMVGGHCRYCPAAHGCPALRSAGLEAVRTAHTVLPERLGDDELSYELKLLAETKKLLDYQYAALEADATHRIQGGATLLGWKVDRGVGRRRWTDEGKAALVGVEETHNVSLLKDPEFHTPAQVESRLKETGMTAKEAKAIVSPLCEAPALEPKLKPVKTEEADRVFGRLTGDTQ